VEFRLLFRLYLKCKKDKFVICRPFYCPNCDSLNTPLDEKLFVVYGGDTQTFYIHKGKFYKKERRGITPSIIFFDGIEDNKNKEIIVACGVVGCGMEIFHTDDKEYPYGISIKKVRLYKMSHADVTALIGYKDETYKLD
jgi:hypothetical protein